MRYPSDNPHQKEVEQQNNHRRWRAYVDLHKEATTEWSGLVKKGLAGKTGYEAHTIAAKYDSQLSPNCKQRISGKALS